jgi:hypothetical protein
LGLNITSDEPDLGRQSCNRLRKHLSSCLRLLIAAKSIEEVRFVAEAIDPDDVAPELGKKINAINVIFFRILKYMARMNFRAVNLFLASQYRLSEIMCIIGPKVITFDFFQLDQEMRLEGWGDWLQTCQNMTAIKLMYHRTQGYSKAAESDFWVAISKLTNLATVDVTGVPIPFIPVSFTNIIEIHLRLWWEIEARDWWTTIMVIFNLMPNLEILELQSMEIPYFDTWTAAMDIYDCKCPKLKEIHIRPHFPKGLLPTIAKCCPNLTSCEFESSNIDNEGLHSLSQLRQLHSLRLHKESTITTGIAYLTNLDQLAELELHFSVGEHMNSQLILDLASHCPKLPSIDISNWAGPFSPGPFWKMSLAEVFPLCGELEEYFEACYRKDWMPTSSSIEKYRIRLDLLRSRPDIVL